MTLEGQAYQVSRVFEALRDFLVYRAKMVCLARGDCPVLMENQASRVFKEHKAYRVCQDFQAPREIRARPAPKAVQVHKAMQAHVVT